MPMLESLLPREQILMRKGGHAWRVWTPAMNEILAKAAVAKEKTQSQAAGSRNP